MPGNFSVGTDIVEVYRIKKLSDEYGERFFNHVFTQQEVDWCLSHANPHIHLAGKFAAKEAVKKALMALGESQWVPLKFISIHRDLDQPPTVNILCALSKSYEVHISISHTHSLATAVAIAELT